MEWSYQISKRGDRNAEVTEPTFANYIPPYSCQVCMYILSHEYNYRICLSIKINYYHSLKGNQNQKVKQDDDIGGFSAPFPNGCTKCTTTHEQFPLKEIQKLADQLLHIRQ